MIATAALTSFPMASAADSARAVSSVYTVSLLATVPMLVAVVAAWMLRHSSAEGRALVWRSAVVALVAIFVGQQLPLHWMAWVIPQTLAAPLVELGRVQVAPMTTNADGAQRGVLLGMSLVQLLFVAYIVGVSLALAPFFVGLARLRRVVRGATPLGGEWHSTLDTLRTEVGIHRRVRLLHSSRVTVPMTCGFFQPVILVPSRALGLTAENRRIVLLHELEHVRAGDSLFGALARVMCSLYWFHPVAWRIAHELRNDVELACDDRVLARGTRRSDYAELLVAAADRLLPMSNALALAERSGLRARLAAVLDVRREVRPLARQWVAVACVATASLAGPMSAVQLAPTRDVLTTLMADTRWESRAYAVLGLAQRPDSVAVARTAAEQDPNPRVRAWARFALGDRTNTIDSAELRAILHTR